MGIFEFIVAIVAVSAIGKTLQSYYAAQQARYQSGAFQTGQGGQFGKDTKAVKALRDEVRALQAELAEMKRSGGKGQGNGGALLTARVQAIEEEVANLRDTTTQFDMSFDAALDRVERRMDRLDDRAPVATTVTPATSADAGQTQYVGQR